MTEVRKALRQVGVSPKLVFDLLTTAAAFAVTYYGIELDPGLAAGLSKVLGFVAGWLVGPGTVEVESRPPAAADPVPPNLEF